jgi:hypothetical protein
MDAFAASWEVGARCRRLSWLLRASVVEAKHAQLARAFKAGFNPNQPRVPAGNPDGGQWTGSGGGGSSSSTVGGDALTQVAQNASFDQPPEVPKERPQDVRDRNRAIRRLARFVLMLINEDEVGRQIGPILDLLEVGSWVAEEYSDHLQSYIDPPKTLEELQSAVSSPTPGSQIHHIVEQGPAAAEEFPRSQIDAPENLVRIPTFKHEEITGWYGKPNKRFGGLSPRDYLRGKSWAERTRVGMEALRDFEVLR